MASDAKIPCPNPQTLEETAYLWSTMLRYSDPGECGGPCGAPHGHVDESEKRGPSEKHI
ncbi:hypothetical protein PAXRUDRAFT_831023 [Paxillus rubicundulus Ve08.2h10]|uniref:Uncharacterized protein n=1 Tax=Paxillus rubicundulus Ve08.2h10 TaxID=930991 RepID=A0A0D0DSN5_9AGAM|nr:hypothetical protein PAXRUDRAFT_831023 [Paxillus rubicundulus Ve08.2h10]